MQRNLRLPKELGQAVVAAAKDRGFEHTAAFMREALRNELARHAGELATAEERIAAKVAVIREDMRLIQAQQHATLTVLDTFVKAFLTCVPEPGDLGAAQSRARQRYVKFRQAIGAKVEEEGSA